MHQDPNTPGTAQPNPAPGTPTPEDPRQREPIHDPPVNPEHDVEAGVEPEDPSPDRVVFDENPKPS